MSHPHNELSDSALDELIANERSQTVAPLTEWSSLAAQLRTEGLLRDETRISSRSGALAQTGEFQAVTRSVSAHRPWYRQFGVQVAGGAALAICGFFAGRSTSVQSSNTVPPTTATSIDHSSAQPTFASTEEAQAALAQSQMQWQQAVNYLAASDSSSPQIVATPTEFQDRLRALDQMMMVMQSALEEAPADPVLNQYYMSTFGARQATVQQLNQTLPVSARLSGF